MDGWMHDHDRNLYNEYALCVKKADGDESACYQARYLARNICPNEWVSW